MNWGECTEVCAKLGVSLPSEAQWEYAARGDTETPWWSGEDVTLLSEVANLADEKARHFLGFASLSHETWSDGQAVHAPIGQFAANPFGLHDVYGNVWEWCLDRYDSRAYQQPAETDPVISSATPHRVSRGGSFIDRARTSRSAVRGADLPDTSGHDMGLRPARRIEP